MSRTELIFTDEEIDRFAEKISCKLKETCRCLKTKSCDEYWGKWLECECGYTSNTTGAKYCGGCGKKIEVIGIIGEQAHFGEH